jgi:hypothetical protein
MKRLTIFLSFLVVSACAWAQITTYSYWFPSYKKMKLLIGENQHDIDCKEYCVFLGLQPDSNYYFYLENSDGFFYRGEESVIVPLSRGKYKIKNSILTLEDNFSGVNIIYRVGKDTLYPICTYSFLNNKILNRERGRWVEIYIEGIPVRRDTNTAYEEVKQYRDEAAKVAPVDTGMYSPYLEEYESLFWLHLAGDSGYTLHHYGKFLLSSGTWQQTGNIIVFHDTTLYHDFYALCLKDTLKMLFFDMRHDRWYGDRIQFCYFTKRTRPVVVPKDNKIDIKLGNDVDVIFEE